MRFSDDGEPQGTAGMPILDVLKNKKLFETAVVVTRYFGGTLLGTGGLVRAYSKATQEGLANSCILEKCLGVPMEVGTDYNGLGKIQYIIGEMGLTVMDTQYTDKVVLECLAPSELAGTFKAKLIEGTGGRCIIREKDPVYYGIKEKQVILF